MFVCVRLGSRPTSRRVPSGRTARHRAPTRPRRSPSGNPTQSKILLSKMHFIGMANDGQRWPITTVAVTTAANLPFKAHGAAAIRSDVNHFRFLFFVSKENLERNCSAAPQAMQRICRHRYWAVDRPCGPSAFAEDTRLLFVLVLCTWSCRWPMNV